MLELGNIVRCITKALGFDVGTLAEIEGFTDDKLILCVFNLPCIENNQSFFGHGLVVETNCFEYAYKDFDEMLETLLPEEDEKQKQWEKEHLSRSPKKDSYVFDEYTSGEDEIICPHCHGILNLIEIEKFEKDDWGYIGALKHKPINCPICGKTFYANSFVTRTFYCYKDKKDFKDIDL